jgi:DNA-binding CsgD family transcriptional regulator
VVLSEVLELFAFGIALHDSGGPLVYANRAARPYLDDPLVVRTTHRARPFRGALASRDDLQVCAIASDSVVVTIITEGHTPDVAAFALLCELTPKEQRIAQLLAQGQTARQIATRLDVSLHTVQSHFKSLFAKTGTKGQNELIARLRGPLAFLAVGDFFAAFPSDAASRNETNCLPFPSRRQR